MNLRRMSFAILFAACSQAESQSINTENTSGNLAPQPSIQMTRQDRQSPLKDFERLVTDSWVVTASSGTQMIHTWKWGPGRWSVERWTDGESARGEPWKELVVYYWDPQERNIRFLGVSPFASGINEGTIEFDGNSATANSTLTQTSGRRVMQTRWSFQSDSLYQETLLEKDSSGKFTELVAFQHHRVKRRDDPSAIDAARHEVPKPFASIKFLIGKPWNGTIGDQQRSFQTSVNWLPIANCIHATINETTSGKSVEFANAYLYHEHNAETLRCLIVCANSDICEGDLREISKGKIQLTFDGRSNTGSRQLESLIEQMSDGSLQQKIQSSSTSNPKDLLLKHHRGLPSAPVTPR